MPFQAAMRHRQAAPLTPGETARGAHLPGSVQQTGPLAPGIAEAVASDCSGGEVGWPEFLPI